MEVLIQSLQQTNKVPKLLLHSCCAPCSTYVIEYLSTYFEITVFYYNPNIDEKSEYERRAKEQKRLVGSMPTKYPVHFEEGSYDVEKYHEKTNLFALEKEGGMRCFICYALRLEESAKTAHEKGFDYFTTTLTISPLKNAQKLNEIGESLAKTYQVEYLVSDFKKKEGYKKSTELSKDYGLYRQEYCGCSYSKEESKQRTNIKERKS